MSFTRRIPRQTRVPDRDRDLDRDGISGALRRKAEENRGIGLWTGFDRSWGPRL